MKILGCGLGAPAYGAGVSPEEVGRRRVTVAGRAPRIRSRVGIGAVGIIALTLAACGGGGGGGGGYTPPPPPPPTTYSIGGTVTGLSGTVVLQDNGGDNLSVTASGAFTFATKVNSGAAYAVTVMTQPSGQTCTVTNGSGTASGNVTNVAVACASSSSGVTIGGTVTGLTGAGLVLLDNGGDNLTVSQNGSFTFKTSVASGKAYAVTVGTQPTGQTCTVVSGSGTAGSTNVTTVAVNCVGAVGKFAYTASNTAGMIYAYTINSTTGALTQVGSPYPDGTAPAAVSLAPNGKFAFSASNSGKQIYAYTIDQTSGALTAVAGSPFNTGFATGSTYPDIAVDAQSAHLYLASAGDAKVAGFAIDPNSGALAPLAGSPYTAGTNAGGIPAFSADGKYLYVVDQNTTGGQVSGYSIDSTTGALTPLAGSPFAAGSLPYWISFTPNNKYAYVSNFNDNTISVYSVNAGVLTAIGTPVAADGSPQDLTIDSTGAHLYVPVSASGGANGGVDVYTINADGTLTVVTGSPFPVGIGPRFVNIDPTGRFAYVSSAGTGGTGVYGFAITSGTGALTALAGSPFATGANSEPQFITIDPSGKFGYTANQGSGTISEFAIDQTSGVLNAVAGSPLTTGGAPFFISISPEAPGIRD